MLDSLLQAYKFLSPGGPVMGLIVASSIFCVALIFERYRALRKANIMPEALLAEIESLAREKKTSEILSVCRAAQVSIGRILASGLAIVDQGSSQVSEAFEMSGKREVAKLEKNLDILAVLAAVGPLLGLLGTVTGMIQTFGVIRVVGVGDPMRLAGGIAEALLNTAGGLVVGIPALVAQRMFLRRVDRFAFEMEDFCGSILRMLKREK